MSEIAALFLIFLMSKFEPMVNLLVKFWANGIISVFQALKTYRSIFEFFF